MESWNFVPPHESRGFLLDETASPPDFLAKGKNVPIMGWEVRSPYVCDFLVPNQDAKEDRGFGGIGLQEMLPKGFQEDSTKDIWSCKVGCNGARMGGSPIMGDPVQFLGEDDSKAKLSSSVVESSNRESCFIDLKLGRLADHTDVHNSSSSKSAPSLSSAESTASTKRARAANLNSQNPCCQVYGCNKDLTSSKDYHKRHRVCEDHSKTPKVIVNGIEQRFCQQCSRFHLLPEFDDGKRSCRKRLAGHNQRRRKPQVGISGRTGRFLQSYAGNSFHGTALPASFICQDILSGALLHQQKFEPYGWSRFIKLEDGTDYSPQSTDTSTSALLHPKPIFASHKYEKQYPFHDNHYSTAKESIFNEGYNHYPHNVGGARSVPQSLFQNTQPGNEDFTVFATESSFQGFTGSADSGRALSLLSNHSHLTQSSGAPFSISIDSHSHYSVSQASETLSGISPQASASRGSNNLTSSEGDHLRSTLISGGQNLHSFEVGSGIFRGPDLFTTEDQFFCEDGATIDLLQLSSQLQRVQHQRNSTEVKQEIDDFCWL